MRQLLVALLALALVPAAWASERHPSLAELEGEVVCPTCHTTLDQSSSPIARQMRAFISRRIAAGDTKSEIKAKLVAEFGPGVIAEPSKHGLDLLAWLLPLGGAIAGGAVLAFAAWRWSRARGSEPQTSTPAIEPELERRVDEELARFD